MFTIEQIAKARDKVKSGADFPKYIQEIKKMGVVSFETWVKDNHTDYFGADNYHISSIALYSDLVIEDISDKEKFEQYLIIHQKGETDYYTFCKHCAVTGIDKWIVNLNIMTCTYYNKKGNKILEEKIAQ